MTAIALEFIRAYGLPMATAFGLAFALCFASGCATSPYEMTDNQAAQISAALAKQVKP